MNKRFLILIASCFAITFVICGCSSTVTTEEFAASVQSGLEARWAYQEDATYKENAEVAVEYNMTSVEKELEQVVSYKEAEFEDTELGKAAKEYISILENQKKMLFENNGDYWTIEYNFDAYQWERHNVLKEINEICNLNFTGTNAEKFGDIISDIYYENMLENPKQVEEAFTILEHVEEKEYDWYSAKVKVRNNTDETFPTYALIYRVKAKDGTIIISDGYAYIYNFVAGSDTWTEDYGYNLEEGYTVEIYGYAASIEDGFIGSTIELKDPIVFAVE